MRILREGLVQSRAACPSTSLRFSLRVEVLDERRGAIFTPYYWARYYERGNFGVKPGKFIVFYPNKEDDPRTAKGAAYPVKPEQIKRFRNLSKDEKDQIRADIKAGRAIATRQGTKGFAGVHFFDEAGERLSETAGPIARRTIDEFLTDVLPSETREIRIAI